MQSRPNCKFNAFKDLTVPRVPRLAAGAACSGPRGPWGTYASASRPIWKGLPGAAGRPGPRPGRTGLRLAWRRRRWGRLAGLNIAAPGWACCTRCAGQPTGRSRGRPRGYGASPVVASWPGRTVAVVLAAPPTRHSSNRPDSVSPGVALLARLLNAGRLTASFGWRGSRTTSKTQGRCNLYL